MQGGALLAVANVACRLLCPIPHRQPSILERLTKRATCYLFPPKNSSHPRSLHLHVWIYKYVYYLFHFYFLHSCSIILLFIWILFDINSVYFKWISIKHQHNSVQCYTMITMLLLLLVVPLPHCCGCYTSWNADDFKWTFWRNRKPATRSSHSHRNDWMKRRY